MIDFIFYTLLFFGVYQVGRIAGRAEEITRIQKSIRNTTDLYNKVIKLAELKGENVAELTNEEINRRINKLEQDTKENRSIY